MCINNCTIRNETPSYSNHARSVLNWHPCSRAPISPKHWKWLVTGGSNLPWKYFRLPSYKEITSTTRKRPWKTVWSVIDIMTAGRLPSIVFFPYWCTWWSFPIVKYRGLWHSLASLWLQAFLTTTYLTFRRSFLTRAISCPCLALTNVSSLDLNLIANTHRGRTELPCCRIIYKSWIAQRPDNLDIARALNKPADSLGSVISPSQASQGTFRWLFTTMSTAMQEEVRAIF